MTENQINDLLERFEKLAAELRDSKINEQYATRENHIATVRNAIALIVSEKKILLEHS